MGTKVPVRTEETIDSATAAEGQTYAAEIADDVFDANGDVVVPRGANAQIVIRSATKGNRFHGTLRPCAGSAIDFGWGQAIPS